MCLIVDGEVRWRLANFARNKGGQMISPDVMLNDGRTMPQLGLGLMRFGSEAETAAVLASAANAGYRLFDSAAVYGNERQVR